MFMGTFQNSIDAKNRMIVPAKHRAELGEGCILTTSLAGDCLCIYSQADWTKRIEKMEGIPESDIEAQASIRDVFSNAVDCDFDKQGRIIIPEHLKERVGIKKELITMGVMNRVEVWAKEVWDSPKNENKFDSKKRIAALAKHGF